MQIGLALFCLVIAIYSARVWRQSPAYSLKSVVGAIVALVTGLALVVVLVLEIANHTPSQSPGVVVLCCVVVIAAVVLGLAAAIVRITDGRAARPPAGTKPLNRHRRKLYPWLWVMGIILLLLIVWANLAGPADADALFVMAGFVLVVGASILGGLYLKARRTDLAIAALKCDFWVHWQQGPGQGESWLGPAGLLARDEFMPWLSSGTYLKEARAEGLGSGYLLFTFAKYPSADERIRVLVPAGRESELEALEAKLRARCPKARIGFGMPTA
ncbi:MAG: hypothetical protein ABR898_03975 [Terracidiphilus sp.]